MIKNNYYKAYDERYKVNHENNILWETTKNTKEIENILKEYNIDKNSKILDLGCGEGRDAIHLLNNSYNVTAIDYSKEAIKMCNKLTDNKYNKKFKQFDLIKNNLNETFDFIYSISVLHMLVTVQHRNRFLTFINKHLNDNGICLLTVLGDGRKEYNSNIEDAFKIVKRTNINTNKEINVTNTSCKIVNWISFEKEIQENNLIITKKWISNDIPGFSSSMCVLLKKRRK